MKINNNTTPPPPPPSPPPKKNPTNKQIKIKTKTYKIKSKNRRCGTVVENVDLACGKLRFNTRQGQNLAVKTGSYSSTA